MCAVLGIIVVVSSILYELLFEVHDDEVNCSPDGIDISESKTSSRADDDVKSKAENSSLKINIMLIYLVCMNNNY